MVSRIPSPIVRRAAILGLPHQTRKSMGTSGNVFESPSALDGVSPS